MMPDEQPETMEWRLRIPRWQWVVPLVVGPCMIAAWVGMFIWQWARLRHILTPPGHTCRSVARPARVLPLLRSADTATRPA